MRRRTFIAGLGAAAAWPMAAWAQRPLPVIGYLAARSPTTDTLFEAAFRQGLKDSGFIEGQSVAIEYRWADGQTARLPALAAELVGRRVSVLAAASTDAALAAHRATSTIPVVFITGADPVQLGLVASFNRPGGTVTGVAFLVNKLVAKRIGLLAELAPGASTIAMLVDPTNANAADEVGDAMTTVEALGRKLLVFEARTQGDIEAAFAALAQQHVSSLFVSADANFLVYRDLIVALAAQHSVVGSYPNREYVAAGGLMSYGPSFIGAYRQFGTYVGRVLKGDKPADLPVMQSEKFEFVLNMKTAKTLGLRPSPGVLSIADEVVE